MNLNLISRPSQTNPDNIKKRNREEEEGEESSPSKKRKSEDALSLENLPSSPHLIHRTTSTPDLKELDKKV